MARRNAAKLTCDHGHDIHGEHPSMHGRDGRSGRARAGWGGIARLVFQVLRQLIRAVSAR
jgi:hypothetical protein